MENGNVTLTTIEAHNANFLLKNRRSIKREDSYNASKFIFALFVAGCKSIYRRRSGRKFGAAPVSDTPKDQIEEKEEETSTLTLDGRVEISSKPVPPVSKETLAAFVGSSENRNLLVSAGGNRPVKEVELTPQLLALWNKACDKLGAQCPDKSDSVVEVRTSGIDFPGLHLESLAVIGIKNVGDSQNEKLYEFVLIQNQSKARGLAPVVWIFNKLTGTGEKDNSDRQSSLSLTTLSYKEVNNSEIVFTSSTHLTVKVKFPAFLLTILPTNKEKAEESGGESISKVLTRDVTTSMNEFEKAYLSTIHRKGTA